VIGKALSVATVVFVLVLFLVGFPGIGLAVVGAIAFLLIRLKIKDGLKKGARCFGSLTEKFILADDLFTIGGNTYKGISKNSVRLSLSKPTCWLSCYIKRLRQAQSDSTNSTIRVFRDAHKSRDLEKVEIYAVSIFFILEISL
jgi:hypothetical protein